MKSLIFTNQLNSQNILSDNSTLYIHSFQALLFIQIVKPQSFSLVKSQSQINFVQSLQTIDLLNKDFWKHLYLILSEDGKLIFEDLNFEQDNQQANQDLIKSMMKLNGFDMISIDKKSIIATKPKWQSKGAPIKRQGKNEQQIFSNTQTQNNPWANIQMEENKEGIINEDELMRDEQSASDKKLFTKFCGDNDNIKAGKPCENCSCGLKEQIESNVTQKDLELGYVESSCGKCYMGDPFRCAGCPYLGLPAFEQGTKVQLTKGITTDTNKQSTTESEQIKVKEIGKKVVLEI